MYEQALLVFHLCCIVEVSALCAIWFFSHYRYSLYMRRLFFYYWQPAGVVVGEVAVGDVAVGAFAVGALLVGGVAVGEVAVGGELVGEVAVCGTVAEAGLCW